MFKDKVIPWVAWIAEALMRAGSGLWVITGIIPSYAMPESLCPATVSSCTDDNIAGLHSTGMMAGLALTIMGLLFLLINVVLRRLAIVLVPSGRGEDCGAWVRRLRATPVSCSLVYELLQLVDYVVLPIMAVLAITGVFIYMQIDGTTPWVPTLQICINHLHEAECGPPGWGATPAAQWPCVWNANATMPFARPCTNPNCGAYARDNAFSLLWEIHFFVFGVFFTHIVLARYERHAVAEGGAAAFLTRRVVLSAPGYPFDQRVGIARHFDLTRATYDVELVPGAEEGNHTEGGVAVQSGMRVVALPPNQLRLEVPLEAKPAKVVPQSVM